MNDVPLSDDREGVLALREALDRSGYTSAALAERLMLEGPFSHDPYDTPLYLRLLPTNDAFTTVTKLFLIGVPVSVEDAAKAFEPLPLERLEAMRVVETTADGVIARVGMLPWSGFLVVSDPLEDELPPSRPDYVLNVIPPSIMLAKLLSPRQIGSALDVGVGSGVQSLLAAEHADRVIGVDVNPRAIAYARFNAVFNRLDNIECREGNVFEAVPGETFDLIVSNPPYVVSPESHYAFRDSGLSGDSFCEGLVRESARHLNEGGRAQLLISWVHGEDEELTAPVRRWLDGSGCDAMLIHHLTQDPLEYAAMWNRPLRWDPVAYSRAIDRWIEYDKELGIERISWGSIVLRRRTVGGAPVDAPGRRRRRTSGRSPHVLEAAPQAAPSGKNWFNSHSLTSGTIDMAGEHVDRIFEAQDVLNATADGEGVLDRRLVLAPNHRLEQSMVIRERTGHVDRAILRIDGGFNFEVDLNRNAFQLVSQLDGRPVREVLNELAETREPETRAELLDSALPMIRDLYGLGFLVPADDEGGEQ